MKSKQGISRRQFVQAAAVAGASFAVPALWTKRAFAAGPLLDPNDPAYLAAVQFKNPVRVPPAFDATTGPGKYTVTIKQSSQSLGLVDPTDLTTPLSTNIYGYNGIYPGPTFVCYQNKPVQVTWVNNLPATHLLDPIDFETIMSAYVPGEGVPIVTHVHGGHSDAAFDGTPYQWYKPSGAYGPSFPGTTTFMYDNSQESGTVWYHDHGLGVTRLNVYVGMAGFFLILDPNDVYLVNKNMLPARQYEFGLAIQDRMFDSTGQFFYPGCGIDTPTTIYPEMFGNFMLVNGVVWPYMEVEPRPYRFRLLNGCDSRVLHLSNDANVPFHQVGTELGLLNSPLDVNGMVLAQPTGDSPTMQTSGLLLMPGERADAVIDFSAFEGQSIYLQNDGNAPMPFGDPETWNPATVGQIMVFKVTKKLNEKVPRSTLPDFLRPVSQPIEVLQPGDAVRTRKLLLFETMDDGFGRIMPLLGTVEDGAMAYCQGPITETPQLGDVEIWEIYNTTGDLHPMHVHLVAHQVLGRFPFTAKIDMNGKLTDIEVDEQANLGLEANEHGWKDTTHMWPGVAPNEWPDPFPEDGNPIQGQMTRIIMKFDKPGEYVWHCHILSHEEHDMMRPIFVYDKKNPVPDWPPMPM